MAPVRFPSPFRYPGGKSWLMPTARRWLETLGRPRLLVEPFAGGATIGLMAALEGLVDQVLLVELDDDVAAVWQAVFSAGDTEFEHLTAAIADFQPTPEAVAGLLGRQPERVSERALAAIVKNRCNYGGIMAGSAGLIKCGDNSRGLGARWYPQTIVGRLHALRKVRAKVTFVHGNGLNYITERSGAAYFIDPPYSLHSAGAGRRLYNHHELDHTRLFQAVSQSGCPALLTYDDSADAVDLANRHGFVVDRHRMKTGHHRVKEELLIDAAGARGNVGGQFVSDQ